ncbi:MAG: alpha/beta fold hydrolase [Nitrospirota bacterium]|nr:alpha/beta fold hydrolase [Nitrospirota bacterium]
MPLIPGSSYCPPYLFNNGHLQTIYPSLARRLSPELYSRERITTSDDDFLDLDWARTDSDSLAILSHGLEGSSYRPYMIGMARALNLHGWDALAWNYRSCSGEINRRLRMYHNGSIDDLDAVIRHAFSTDRYRRVALIGFSLGGNLTLMYLGSLGTAIDHRIESAAAFSVPCDLAAGARELAKPRNCFYMQQFLVSLHGKIRKKMELLPGEIDDKDYHRIRNFKEFDDRYTAPIHGFKNAEDYWAKCSCKQFIPSITIPTLIVNSRDDPFLVDGCYPVLEAERNRFVHLEMPRHGGHVGFVQFDHKGTYWSEQRAMEFLAQEL